MPAPSTATAGGRGQGSLTGLPPAFLLHLLESNLGRLWRPLRTASQPVTLAVRELPQPLAALGLSGAIRGGVIQMPPPRKPGQAKTHPRGWAQPFSSSLPATAYAFANLTSIEGSLQLAFCARLASMGPVLTSRWRALASHKASAFGQERMALCRRARSRTVKACRMHRSERRL